MRKKFAEAEKFPDQTDLETAAEDEGGTRPSRRKIPTSRFSSDEDDNRATINKVTQKALPAVPARLAGPSSSDFHKESSSNAPKRPQTLSSKSSQVISTFLIDMAQLYVGGGDTTSTVLKSNQALLKPDQPLKVFTRADRALGKAKTSPS